MDTCAFCRGPFHISTGELVGNPQTYPLCGQCMHGALRFMKGQLSVKIRPTRNSDRILFYKHVTPLPPAVELSFTFVVSTRETYPKMTEVVEVGVTFEEARLKVQAQYPSHIVPDMHMRGCWWPTGSKPEFGRSDASYHADMEAMRWLK